MRTLLALVFLALAGQAHAFVDLRPQDPHPAVADHYQNTADLPVQERLDDCWAFEVQTWRRPLDHWTHAAAWACAGIARQHAVGRPLGDHDAALESLLLAYEQRARAWSAQSLTHASEARFQETVFDPPKALLLASGWYLNRFQQDAAAGDLGLLVVLETLR
jgi:hypothetical protein